MGVSSCLLGERVRYDGRHKRDNVVTKILSRVFEFVPVCPEVSIGLGVPRAPIRLVGRVAAPRAIGVADASVDVTDKLASFGACMGRDLADLSGYIFKSRSPSCGLEHVMVYANNGGRSRYGQGVYARAFVAARPQLPVEQEDRLADPRRRENFVERVFAFRRWQDMLDSGLTPAKLAAFHGDHRIELLTRGYRHHDTLGKLVAAAGRRRLHTNARVYLEEFMTTLAKLATPQRHARALMQLAARLRGRLDSAQENQLRHAIHQFRLGCLPRAVPIALLKRHFHRSADSAVLRQTYLNS